MDTYLIIDILLLVSCIFELSTKKIKQKIIFIWMIFFTLFGGLRWEIGGDWAIYKGYFDAAQWNLESILSYKRWEGDISIEPGYMFLSALVKMVFIDEYWCFNLLMGFFAQYTYYRFSMEFSPRRPLLMYALILGTGMYSYMFVRSGLSVVVCYWAYRYIRDRKMMRFLLVVIVAGFIHRQVLLFIPLYWAVKWHFRWKVYVIGYLCCCVAYMLLKDYITLLIFALGDLGDMTEKLQWYTDEDVGKLGRQISYGTWVMYFIMLSIFLFFRKKFKLEEDDWYNCMLVGFFIIIASNTVFTEGMSTLGRISVPYKPARTILVMMVINQLLDNGRYWAKRFALAFFLGLAMINIYKDVNDPLMDICFAPYRSIFGFNIL